MRILMKAMRAVVVELLGVMLVLWLLFGGVTWTLDSARRPTSASAATRHPGEGHFESAWGSDGWQSSKQSEGVGARLDYYSRYYRQAASGYLRQVAKDLTSDLSTGNRVRAGKDRS